MVASGDFWVYYHICIYELEFFWRKAVLPLPYKNITYFSYYMIYIIIYIYIYIYGHIDLNSSLYYDIPLLFFITAFESESVDFRSILTLSCCGHLRSVWCESVLDQPSPWTCGLWLLRSREIISISIFLANDLYCICRMSPTKYYSLFWGLGSMSSSNLLVFIHPIDHTSSAIWWSVHELTGRDYIIWGPSRTCAVTYCLDIKWLHSVIRVLFLGRILLSSMYITSKDWKENEKCLLVSVLGSLILTGLCAGVPNRST